MQYQVCRRGMPRRTLLSLAIASLLPGFAHAAETLDLGSEEVVATTPLPGIDLARDKVPANIQTLDGERLNKLGGQSLAEKLQRGAPSININETQGNPYQADLNYRGFTASPLLGTPQGLSVFLDGVRVNEAFGDVVHWDLIPNTALASMALVPGSNPLYGLNTLGGALALQTKRGDTHPGGSAEVSGGSFGRFRGAVEHGGKHEEFSWYLAAEGMDEDGWRDHSPSEVGQLFGKFAWTTDSTDIALTLAHADNDLIGNGLIPESMHRLKRESIFTYPDQTENRSHLMALSASHWLSDSDRLSGTLYLRRTRTATLNGDGNDEYEDEYEEWEDDGFVGEGPESGVLNRTNTAQRAYGLALQWTRYLDDHQVAFGLSHDNTRASFHQSEQGGELTDARGIRPTEDEEAANSLLGRTRTSSLYATDTWSLTDDLQLTGSLRYNRTRVVNTDRMGDALNGDFTYRKLNPALGFAWQLQPAVTLYGGFSQGNRAPTPIELGCADPENPCSLPNAMAADPFLEQVVTRTLEFGLRGELAGGTRWNASAFRSMNHDDLLFVGTGGSMGYFTNFGRTLRQGIELGLAGQQGPLDWRADYSYLHATFRSGACILAENNSSEGEGGCPDDEIRVSSGDYLPALPKHNLKLGVDWNVNERLRVGTSVLAYSSQYVRGNENNRHRANGDVQGSGKLPGYAVVNLTADYRLASGWTLFGRVDNLFDKRYATGGALAENPFVGAGNAFAAEPDEWRREQFIAPGAPRAAWVGMRYRWDAF